MVERGSKHAPTLCLLAVASFSAGCSLEDPGRFLRWPTERADAFVLWTGGDVPLLIAGEGRTPVVLNDVSADAPLELWRYPQSLAALALEPGSLAIGLPCRQCALLEPDQVYRAESPADWQAVTGDEALREALVPDRAERCEQYCPAWELERIDLLSAGYAIERWPWTPTAPCW